MFVPSCKNRRVTVEGSGSGSGSIMECNCSSGGKGAGPSGRISSRNLAGSLLMRSPLPNDSGTGAVEGRFADSRAGGTVDWGGRAGAGAEANS